MTQEATYSAYDEDPDDAFQLAYEAIYSAYEASIPSRVAAYTTARATNSALPLFSVAPAGQAVSKDGDLGALLGGFLWAIFWRLAAICVCTLLCFWASHAYQDLIDRALAVFGLVWYPIRWPEAAIVAWRDFFLGLILQVLQNAFLFVALATNVIYDAIRLAYHLCRNACLSINALLGVAAASMASQINTINHSHHANLVRQRLQSVCHALFRLMAYAIGLCLVVLIVFNPFRGSGSPGEMDLSPFYVPDYVIRAQPQNRPRHGSSSHHRRPVEPIEWDVWAGGSHAPARVDSSVAEPAIITAGPVTSESTAERLEGLFSHPMAEETAAQLVQSQAPGVDETTPEFVSSHMPTPRERTAELARSSMPSPSARDPEASSSFQPLRPAKSGIAGATQNQRRCLPPEETAVYCRACRQRHCCELPY